MWRFGLFKHICILNAHIKVCNNIIVERKWQFLNKYMDCDKVIQSIFIISNTGTSMYLLLEKI